MRKGRRRRRVSLRGWWRALPFVMMAGGIFFEFTWLHAQRLHNEYRAIELTAEIDRVKDRIANLRGERYRLGRMERISEAAPEHDLVEPRPGQVQVMRATQEDAKTFAMAAQAPSKPARPTRSVVLILDAPAAKPLAEAPDTALAQTKTSGAAAAEGNL
jgi:hypothetical protein